ncbi:nucleotidyltransferase [Streptomyces bauhiniae]|uniref:nucleotidyltransferase n=1 Tax=Streptomyces bauhiniae TaxID=2340725 RepID=UPI0036AB6AE6
MSGPPVPHGLDAEGFIAREGSLARVQDAFRPVVAAARDGLSETFGGRLHSGYLSEGRLLSEAERYDMGWFLACLCTPLFGDDLAGRLPRYRPTPRLARETNGDLAALLPRWRERIAGAADSEEARRPLVRFMSRHLVRTGFTLVMPRWNGWTSDLAEMAEVFGAYHPRRAAQIRVAARYGHEPVGNAAILRGYVEDLGPWLAGEYARVHGQKTRRPDDSV